MENKIFKIVAPSGSVITTWDDSKPILEFCYSKEVLVNSEELLKEYKVMDNKTAKELEALYNEEIKKMISESEELVPTEEYNGIYNTHTISGSTM